LWLGQMRHAGKLIVLLLMPPPDVIIHRKTFHVDQKGLDRGAGAFGDRLIEIGSVAAIVDAVDDVSPSNLVIGVAASFFERHRRSRVARRWVKRCAIPGEFEQTHLADPVAECQRAGFDQYLRYPFGTTDTDI